MVAVDVVQPTNTARAKCRLQQEDVRCVSDHRAVELSDRQVSSSTWNQTWPAPWTAGVTIGDSFEPELDRIWCPVTYDITSAYRSSKSGAGGKQHLEPGNCHCHPGTPALTCVANEAAKLQVCPPGGQ